MSEIFSMFFRRERWQVKQIPGHIKIFVLITGLLLQYGLAKAETAMKDAELMQPETTVHLAYDDSYFYVGFKCEEPALDSTPKSSLWSNGIEFYLDTNHDRETYFQVGVTPGGKVGLAETRVSHMEFKLKDKLKIKTSYGKKCWFAETAIPFESMGIKCPSPGTIWGINLCRGRQGTYGSWPLLSGTWGFHDPANFADLHFEGDKTFLQPGSSSRVIAIRKISSPVKIDGELGENAWKESAKVTGFVLVPKKAVILRQEPKDGRIKEQAPRAKILSLIGEHYKEHAYTGMFSKEDFALAKEYIKKYSWANEAFDKIKQDADYWASKSDEELYNFIPLENPRATCPCYSFGCPVCGTGKDTYTTYVLATSLETPNRWKCTTCGRWWGPGEEVEYNGKKFKITDDGSGWTVPEGLPGSGHKCYFVAAWRTYALYVLLGSHGITIKNYYRPKSAVGTLATVYAITGDAKYAHKALLILNRVAQLYPTYDGVIDRGSRNSMPHISWVTAGEEEIVDACCYAYNIVFDYLPKDKELIDFFKKKRHEDLDNDGQITYEDIRRNIAVNLFGYMYEWLLRARFYSFGDWMVAHAGQMALIGRTLENPDIVYEALEGKRGFRELMRRLCYNDGRFFYNSLSYNFSEANYLGKVLFAVNGYYGGKRFREPVDLFHDKTIIFERLVDYAYGIICNGRIPCIGDAFVPRERINPAAGKSCIHSLRMFVPRYSWLAGGIKNKDKFMKELVDSILNSQPRSALKLILEIPEIEKIVRKAKLQPQRSRLFTDTGLAILRTVHEGIDQVHAILNYGVDGDNHGHHDQLSLNIIAHGYELTINKGYPWTWSRNAKVWEWLFDTKAQNTVRIDGENQMAYPLGAALKHAGKLHSYQDNELVGIVDGASESVYPELADLYRRAIFLIKDSEHPFIVDVFNVAGGTTHDYQFHAQSDIEGKNFEIDRVNPKLVKEIPQYIDSRFMYDIKRANTKDSFIARWWIGDEDNTGLILHMIKGKTRRTVITCKGQAEGSDKPVPCDPHIIVRERGKKNSQFVSVIFPYHGSMPEYRVEKLKSLRNRDEVVALRITLGRKTYLVFYDIEGKKKHHFRYGKHNYTFSGIGGVILEEDGKLKSISLSEGRLIGKDDTVFKSEPMKEGRVTSIDEMQKSIVVEGTNFPSKLPCLLKWSDKQWTYRVIKVEKIGHKLKMYLDTFSFKNGYENFLIQEGDRVSLISDTYVCL